MRTDRPATTAILCALALASAPIGANAARKLPYWASLSATEAMVRSGPGRNFPALWLYKRVGLPVKVVATYTVAHNAWRKIEDPDGTTGWMQANLLSERRSALVLGTVRPLRARPEAGAPVVWRAAPGVVGRISKCDGTYCAFDVGGKLGFVEAAHVHGVAPGEILP